MKSQILRFTETAMPSAYWSTHMHVMLQDAEKELTTRTAPGTLYWPELKIMATRLETQELGSCVSQEGSSTAPAQASSCHSWEPSRKQHVSTAFCFTSANRCSLRQDKILILSLCVTPSSGLPWWLSAGLGSSSDASPTPADLWCSLTKLHHSASIER